MYKLISFLCRNHNQMIKNLHNVIYKSCNPGPSRSRSHDGIKRARFLLRGKAM